MGVKLRDYVTEEKMKMTPEEVRAFLYSFFDVPKKEQQALEKKRKLANKTHVRDTIKLNQNSFDKINRVN